MGNNLKLEITEVSTDSRFLVSNFLKTIPISKKSFRYFDSRDLNCLDNHLITLIFQTGQRPVAYGHLDSDEGKVWLGVCVSDDYHGNKLGQKMMQHLFKCAEKLKLSKINLSVDKNNKVAYNLYIKMGFTLERDNEKSFFMKKEL